MKTKIYLVTFTSYTESDNYLHNEQKTFTNPLFAQDYYEKMCNNARENTGDIYDTDSDRAAAISEQESRQDVNNRTFKIERETGTELGYQVEVKLQEVEIEIPVYAVTYASHTREDYDDNLHMDDPQIFTSKSEAREEYEGMKRYAENTAANDYDDTGDGKRYTPEIDTEEDDQGNETAATIKRTDNPLSIYTGRVELHTL